MRKTVGKVFATAVFCTCLALAGCGGSNSDDAPLQPVAEEQLGAFAEIPDGVMDDRLKGYLAYLGTPFDQTGLDEEDELENGYYYAGQGEFLGEDCKVHLLFSDVMDDENPLTAIEIVYPEDYDLQELAEELQEDLGVTAARLKSSYIVIPLYDTGYCIHAFPESSDGSSIYVEYWIDTEAVEEDNALASITSYSDIPGALMNDKFKKALELLDKPFGKSGFSKSDGENTGAGTYIFELAGCKFVGEGFDKNADVPCVVYPTKAVKSGKGAAEEISFEYYTSLSSNGYEETVDLIDDISDALGVDIEIDNDYNSSSKLAGGTYCTVEFPGVDLQMEVKNRTGYVQVVISKLQD